MRSVFQITFLAVCLLLSGASAFVTPQTSLTARTTAAPAVTATSTQLFERQWNFNEGQGPFGLKKNAEIWNGRVAQMGFIFVFLQELITGKGVVQGLQEGDPLNYAAAGLTVVSILGLSAFLASKGKEDYVKKGLAKK